MANLPYCKSNLKEKFSEALKKRVFLIEICVTKANFEVSFDIVSKLRPIVSYNQKLLRN